MAHAAGLPPRPCKRKKYSAENVAREAGLKGSDSNDLMKVYINHGIGKLLLVSENGWGKGEEYGRQHVEIIGWIKKGV